MDERYSELVEMINENGIKSVLNMFGGDINKVLWFISKKKLWDYIEMNSIDDDYISQALMYMMNYNQQELALDYILGSMSSISFDDNDYFYEVRDLEELADWFKDYNRDVSPHNIAKSVLGEDFWEPFGFYYDVDLMTEVYDNLTDENKKILRNTIVEKYGEQLIGIPIKNVTDVIEKIGTEDENGDYEFKITNENIMDLFSDDDTMNFLFKNYLDDVESNLMSLYSNSYNSAYEDEYYTKVWEELKENFLDADAKPIDFKYGSKTRYKLKITNVLPKLIKKYLEGKYCHNIDSLGDYNYLISEGINCDVFEYLSFRIYDYPDSRSVSRNMNENFKEYF
jgi:hypothetical protein